MMGRAGFWVAREMDSGGSTPIGCTTAGWRAADLSLGLSVPLAAGTAALAGTALAPASGATLATTGFAVALAAGFATGLAVGLVTLTAFLALGRLDVVLREWALEASLSLSVFGRRQPVISHFRETPHDLGHEPEEDRRHAPRDLEDLGDADRLEVLGYTGIGDDVERQNPLATVNRHDDLGNEGHAHHVGADPAQEPVLRGSVALRPRHHHEHRALARHAQVRATALGQLDQAGAVGLAPVRKARAQPVVVLANQGIVAHQVDVIARHHQRARGH